MKQHFILITISLIILCVQSFCGCTHNTHIRVIIKNTHDESKLIWFSKDSSAIHYFYGSRPGAISIMHAIYDESYRKASNETFVSPYLNFISVLETNDSLVVYIRDSTDIKDIRVFDYSSLGFIDKQQLAVIKRLGYKKSDIVLSDTRLNSNEIDTL